MIGSGMARQAATFIRSVAMASICVELELVVCMERACACNCSGARHDVVSQLPGRDERNIGQLLLSSQRRRSAPDVVVPRRQGPFDSQCVLDLALALNACAGPGRGHGSTPDKGCHSVCDGSSVYVVFDSAQTLPSYVVDFKLVQ